MTFSLFLLIWCLCLSKEWVSLSLVVTEHAAAPRREMGWGTEARIERAGEISLPTWYNTKQSEHLGPIHFCRQTNQRGKALNPPKPVAAAPRKSKRTMRISANISSLEAPCKETG